MQPMFEGPLKQGILTSFQQFKFIMHLLDTLNNILKALVSNQKQLV